MSLLPFVDDFMVRRPSKILDQHFGLCLEPDDFMSLAVPSMIFKCPAGYLRNWRPAASDNDTGSVLSSDREKFQAKLDVQQFKPEEITVKVSDDNTITVEGKHEEKEDEHGSIFRHFVRKYSLPDNCDISKINSQLSSDGILSIIAPKKCNRKIKHKEIPIEQTGEPAKKKKMIKKLINSVFL